MLDQGAALKEFSHRVANDLALVVAVIARRRGQTHVLSTGEILDEVIDAVASLSMLYRQIHERSVDDDLVDLGQHLTNICARMNTGYLSGLGITLLVNAPAVFAPSALAHSLALIVLKLVTNAARHSEALRIGVELSTACERWSCAVIDDGIGLPDAFSTTSRGGLHFVGRLASGLDGRLSITSHPQKGTSMRVCFPAPSHPSVLSPSR